MSRAEGRIGINTRSATAIPGSIRSILAGPVSMNTHCQPLLTSNSMASAVASTSNSFGFFTLPRRVHQLARLSCGSRSSSATRRHSSAARTASALARVVLPTPPLVLASVTTRSRAGCLGAMWYLDTKEENRRERVRGTTNNVVPNQWYLGAKAQLIQCKVRTCPQLCLVPATWYQLHGGVVESSICYLRPPVVARATRGIPQQVSSLRGASTRNHKSLRRRPLTRRW